MYKRQAQACSALICLRMLLRTGLLRLELSLIHILRVLGHNMAYFLKCMAAGAAQGVSLPPREPAVRTN